MLSPPWLYVTALGAAFVLAALASPVGVSGAVLLLPFQVSVLGTPSPAVTPTNLLYNIVATPGALYRYWRQQQTGGPLTRILLLGTVPGVIVGAIVRVEFLPGDRAFAVVVAAVLIPLGVWTCVGRRGAQTIPAGPLGFVRRHSASGGSRGLRWWHLRHWRWVDPRASPRRIRTLANGGCASNVASTFVTSIAGVVTFVILSSQKQGAVGPDWGIGLALGAGGLLGGYTGRACSPIFRKSSFDAARPARPRDRHSLRLAGSGIAPCWQAQDRVGAT